MHYFDNGIDLQPSRSEVVLHVLLLCPGDQAALIARYKLSLLSNLFLVFNPLHGNWYVANFLNSLVFESVKVTLLSTFSSSDFQGRDDVSILCSWSRCFLFFIRIVTLTLNLVLLLSTFISFNIAVTLIFTRSLFKVLRHTIIKHIPTSLVEHLLDRVLSTKPTNLFSSTDSLFLVNPYVSISNRT